MAEQLPHPTSAARRCESCGEEERNAALGSELEPLSECEADEPISGVKCERVDGHDGAHIFVNTNTVIAWGWPQRTGRIIHGDATE